MDYHKFREDDRNEQTAKIDNAGFLAILLYGIALICLGLSWLNVPFVKNISNIIFYPTVFQLKDSHEMSIVTSIVLIGIYVALLFILQIFSLKTIKQFVKIYFFLPIFFNLAIHVWSFGNEFIEGSSMLMLLRPIIYIVKIVVLFQLFFFMIRLWFHNTFSNDKETLYFDPISESIDPNYIDHSLYWNHYLGAVFYPKDTDDKYVRYSRKPGGLFELYELPEDGVVKKTDEKDIQSYIDIVDSCESLKVGDVVRSKIESDSEETEHEIEVLDFSQISNDVFTIGQHFAKLLYKNFNKEVVFGLDTNLLLNHPKIISEILKYKPVVISQKVFEELDMKKTDEEVGYLARSAMASIEENQLNHPDNFEILPYDKNKTKSLSPDEIIVDCYKKRNEETSAKVIFLSNDRGARIIARNQNLIASDL